MPAHETSVSHTRAKFQAAFNGSPAVQKNAVQADTLPFQPGDPGTRDRSSSHMKWFGFVCATPFYAGMIVAERIDTYARKKIKIPLVGFVDQVGACATIYEDFIACIRSKQVLAFEFLHVLQVHKSESLAWIIIHKNG